MAKFALFGAIAGVAAHAIALYGLLVSAVVFSAPASTASADPMIYIWTVVLTVIWALGVASLATPRHTIAAAVGYIVAWSLAGIFTLGVTWWWALSIAIVCCATALGWSIGTLLSRRLGGHGGGLARDK